MSDLLYEIGTEELPAGYLEPALEALVRQVGDALESLGLGGGTVRATGSPRRLVLCASGIPARQPTRSQRSVGPPAQVAFGADGTPTAAALGFARAQGVAVEDLRVEQTGKGPYVVAVRDVAGQAAGDLLPQVLAEATAAITFPKSMRWERGGFAFARPIRWLVALLDDSVLPVQVADVRAGRTTQGHPFLGPRSIELADASFDAYREVLRRGRVLVDLDERRSSVRAQVDALMAPHGCRLDDFALLEEVTNMVQWPHAVEGSFDEAFLDVPAPVVVAALKEHQRYFPVRGAEGQLLPLFITVSDRTQDEEEVVREGNERVLQARLDDARFHWEQDLRRPLGEIVPALANVVFLGGLGDNLQRTRRLVELSGQLAEGACVPVSVEHVRRAAYLCKADLLTGLVGEFASLQGVVGRELARVHGEPEPVGTAIAEHYLPAGTDSALPASPEGAVLALADKIDVIVGCFSLGLLPKGSQDPYALRRNALGILLILEHTRPGISLETLLGAARRVAGEQGIHCDDGTAAAILDFFRDRLYHASLERGHPHDFVRATMAAGFGDVGVFWQRLAALAECSRTQWWPALVELVDRTYRIARDLEEIGPVDEGLLREPLEKQLAQVWQERSGGVAASFEAGEYVAAAEAYCAAFAEPVHQFFDQVFVNVEDEAVRTNRKSLCGRVHRLFADRFADLYLIETTARSGGPLQRQD
jgi:glycyl-tRNA synthetase beta chain